MPDSNHTPIKPPPFYIRPWIKWTLLGLSAISALVVLVLNGINFQYASTLDKFITLSILGTFIGANFIYTELFKTKNDTSKQKEIENLSDKIQTMQEEAAEFENIKRTFAIENISSISADISRIGETDISKWTPEIAKLHQTRILDSTKQFFASMSINNIRALLYQISDAEGSSSDKAKKLILVDHSSGSTPPRRSNLIIDHNDKYGLFQVLQTNVPSRIKRDKRDLLSKKSAKTFTADRKGRWRQSIRIAVKPAIPGEQNLYLFIVDTPSETKLPAYADDIIVIFSHLFTVIHQYSLAATNPSNLLDDVQQKVANSQNR